MGRKRRGRRSSRRRKSRRVDWNWRRAAVAAAAAG
jgi:hypothetical protein